MHSLSLFQIPAAGYAEVGIPSISQDPTCCQSELQDLEERKISAQCSRKSELSAVVLDCRDAFMQKKIKALILRATTLQKPQECGRRGGVGIIYCENACLSLSLIPSSLVPILLYCKMQAISMP